MIQLTRSLARQTRAVLRNSVLAGAHRGTPLALVFCTGEHGLTVRAQGAQVGLEYHQPGELPPETIWLPVEALDDFNGPEATSVILETTAPNTVQARWDDVGVPQLNEYSAMKDQPVPASPSAAAWVAQESRLLSALAEAAKTTATDSTRYALMKVQLRGERGQVVATDGRQLFVEAGFEFPWNDDVIVPAVAALGSKLLASDTAVAMARTAAQVGIRVGAWTFWLQIDQQARYPRTEDVIPAKASRQTSCRLTARDAEFLARTLPRMPGQDDADDPVTIDLNGHLSVRARSEAQGRITEIALPQSTVAGPPVRFRVCRFHLARALALGFSEFQVVDASQPVVCQDERRSYVWMLLGKDGALAPTDEAARISPPVEGVEQLPAKTKARKKIGITSANHGTRCGHITNGKASGHTAGENTEHQAGSKSRSAASAGLASLVEDAQAIKDVVRDCCRRTNRLVAALKRHRRQSRLLTSTVSALRQLHRIDG